MPNKPISDAELAELKRLQAAAIIGTVNVDGSTVYSLENGCNDVWFGVNVKGNHQKHDQRRVTAAQYIAALHNAFPAILARLAEAERERDELECQVEELEANAIEYEKDCTKALCGLARDLDYEWDGDGATADELREFISGLLSERGISKALADRDAQQRREGSAEWLETNAATRVMTREWMIEAAKRLREAK